MRTTYHHGDARAALVDAGLRLLSSTAATELSLRQVAEEAGLSRQAPYNHFAGKEGLLAALAEAGFVSLGAALDRVSAAAKTPEQALASLADAYIRFARDSPQRFRLMFQRELVDLSKFPEAAGASAQAFARLARLVEAIVGEADALDRSISAWSLVHGYAVLSIELEFEPVDLIASRAALFAKLISGEATGGGGEPQKAQQS